jgi:probable HAF family extracellular repeat protein
MKMSRSALSVASARARLAPVLALAAFVAAPGVSPAQPVVDSLTYLDAAYAYDVNDSGQVVGLSSAYRAYLYDNGTFTNITPAGGGVSYAYAINNSGRVAGYSMVSGTPTAFVYDSGTSTLLSPTLTGMSWGRGINDAGTVVGDHSSGGANSFSLTTGNALTSFFNGGNAFAINNHGVVAGDIPDSQFISTHAATFDGTTTKDLGTLGGTLSAAYAINDAGVVVGYSYVTGSSNTHGFIYSGGTMSDLGTLGGATSTARGINNGGDIVGNSAGTDFVGNHAFVYRDGTMYDLTTLAQDAGLVQTGPITASTTGFTSLDIAYAISDTGWIVGTGTYYVGNWTGYQKSFLLKLDSSASPVPEPATCAAWLGLGAIAFGCIRRFRARRAVSA